MVAHQWLVNAVAVADDNWMLRQQPERPTDHAQQIQEEPSVESSDEEDSSVEDSSVDNCDNSSASVMSDPFREEDLAEYGLTLEQHKAHIDAGLSCLGSQSTKRQYARLHDEFKEFSMAVFKDDAITVERALKFLQFQAHREIRVKKDNNSDEVVERAAKKHKTKRANKTNRTSTKKYAFKVEDYTKVMDHIQNDIVGVDPEKWVARNRLHSISKH
jgi:hypothetical protein